MFDLDITKCFGKNCPIKEKCIRYIANPDKYQFYYTENQYFDKHCE